jgi:hypothetical protein
VRDKSLPAAARFEAAVTTLAVDQGEEWRNWEMKLLLIMLAPHVKLPRNVHVKSLTE